MYTYTYTHGTHVYTHRLIHVLVVVITGEQRYVPVEKYLIPCGIMLAPLIRECLIVAASCPNTNVLFGRTVHVPAVSGSLHHALHMRTVEHHHIQAHNTYLLHTRTPKLRSYTHFAAPQSKPRPSTSAQRIPPRRALPQA